jgi:hypothetical protein
MAATTPTSASTQTEALQELAAFPLVEALFGRRSRRFALGDEIPDSPLAYRSRRQPLPLSELERMLVLSAMGGTTGWHFSITRHARYAPHVSNYAGGAAGRTFPSAAGFHTAELFFTDDSGLYFFPTRDAGALIDPAIDQVTPELMVERHRFSMLGASGNPDVPGLGFRYDEDERWSTPNPTGRQGVFEAYCPPHYPNMAAAVEAFAERKFGPGGPFHPDTPGAWTDSPGVRGSAQVHDQRFKACVALQAQYVLDTFGKFPGTVPTVFIMNYVQAHHLDLDFYDRFFEPGAYLDTHAQHMPRWHGGPEEG